MKSAIKLPVVIKIPSVGLLVFGLCLEWVSTEENNKIIRLKFIKLSRSVFAIKRGRIINFRLCDLPLNDMVRAREKWMKYMIMGVEVSFEIFWNILTWFSTRHMIILNPQVEPEQSLNYGCLGINDKTKEIVHYVEKPSSFVSNHINAGVYLLSSEVWRHINDFQRTIFW